MSVTTLRVVFSPKGRLSMTKGHRRRIGLIVALAMVVGAFAVPASAKKPDPDSDLVSGHKIWICHATRSLSNPYVKILIDIAAWDIEDPDSNDHGPEHHLREKDGVVWGDYALANPDDECSLDIPPPPPPPPPDECPDGSAADYVVTFPGNKLVPRAPTQEVAIDVAAGTYDVTLISGDYNRGSDLLGNPLVQPNERWRLLGSTSSGYSMDLPDTVANISGEVTSGLTVVFDAAVTSVVAQHWSVATRDFDPNSVVPEYACLTLVEDGGGEV